MSLCANSFLCSFLTQKFWMYKKVSEKEEKKDINKWACLPDEILELIMKRLCLNDYDYLALGTICSPWRSTVTNAIANNYCHPLPELPLIVLSSNNQVLFSLRTEREHFPKRLIFESIEISCHGSVEGWMIMCDYVEKDCLSVFFFNPVTYSRVPVPSLLYFPSSSPIQGEELFIGRILASSAPDCNKPGYYYLAGLFNDDCHIAFYRPFDKSWNMIETEKDSEVQFLDLEIMGSKLYVRTDEDGDFHYSILIYDLKDFGNGSPKPKVSVMVPEASTPYVSRIVDSHCHDSGYAYCCLAKHESLEQLFFIYILCNVIYKPEHVDSCNPEFVTSPEITAVEVFKLEMNKEPLQWIKCQSLDDNVIFVSGITNMVMSRAALSSTDQELIRENSVYFALSFECPSDPWQGVRLGVKHLTDSSIKYFSVEKSNHSVVPYPLWFVPSI